MKKILFALVCALTMMLTSCFENTGYSQSETFWQYVTIDSSQTMMEVTVKLIADYPHEEYTPDNLKYPEQLEQFGLADARRAHVQLNFQYGDTKKPTLTLLQAQKIDVQSVANTLPQDSLQHLLGLQQQYQGYTYVWVSEGYLSTTPVIPSASTGKYRLTAEKATGDTLYLKLSASYEKNDKMAYYDKLQSFDLRTLCDTIGADEEMLVKMREVIAAMENHRTDSMRIVLLGDYLTKSLYTGKDTIVTDSPMAITNYFRTYKVLP